MSSLKKNKRVVFLVPYPLQVVPGQRFRFEQYLLIMYTHGFSVTILPFLSEDTNTILYTSGNYWKKITGVVTGIIKRIASLPRLMLSQYVFIFREAAPIGPPFFEWLIAKVLRKKVIYDFDDAIWLPNTTYANRAIGWLKRHSKVSSICKWSYRVSCGNPYLANYARAFNSEVKINPTTIDTENLHNPKLYPTKKETDKIVIGWTGTHSTLHYLEPLLPILELLSKKYPLVRILVIADKKPNWSLPSLQFVKWNKQTEIEDLRKIDIGLMPLTDDPWAHGKCGFKALQYLSMEIPAVVSPVGVNTAIVDHGINGFVCRTHEEWSEALEQLIQQKEMRQTMGRRGREKVITHYSVTSNLENFLSLFE